MCEHSKKELYFDKAHAALLVPENEVERPATVYRPEIISIRLIVRQQV